MSERTPIYRPFRKQLQRRYNPEEAKGDATPLPILIAALGTVNQNGDIHLSLLERLHAASGTDFDELTMSAEEAALLSWIDESFRILMRDHALDGNLAAKVQNLLPVAAALALSEEAFYQPGDHPLHRLIDAVYLNCLGWYRGLGKSGHALWLEVERCEALCQGYFTL
jgi:hypothetical protein